MNSKITKALISLMSSDRELIDHIQYYIDSKYVYEKYENMNRLSVLKTLRKRRSLNMELLKDEDIAGQLDKIIEKISESEEEFICQHSFTKSDDFIIVYTSSDVKNIYGVFRSS